MRVYAHEVSGVGCQVSGVRSQVSGVRCQSSENDLCEWLSKSGITLISDLRPPSSVLRPLTSEQGVRLALWGSGTPLREFLYSDDLAEACVFLVENADYKDMAFTDESGTVHAHINIGSGKEATIREIAETVKAVIGFKGELKWDASKPDGTPRKLMDSSRINALGWTPKVDLKAGIAKAYADYLARIK
jgi:GDP-L-fucose synthase